MSNPLPVSPRAVRIPAAVLALLLATATVASSQPGLVAEPDDFVFAPQTFELPSADKAVSPLDAKPVRQAASQRAGLDLGNLSAVHLAPVDRDKLFREDAQAPLPGMTKLQRIGVGRDVDLRIQDGAWYDLADGGRLWVAEVAGDGAIGLRLGFSRLALPRGAELAVYAAGGTDKAGRPADVEFVSDGPTDLAKAAAGTYWTQVLFGERARVELYVPAALAARVVDLPFTLDRAQYLYRDPLIDEALDKATCHNDVTCFSSWASTAKGVARFSFVDGGSSFLCSGQLINNFAGDRTPYFLTADHCVHTAGAATSSTFFWLYQTSTCNGAVPSLASLKQSTNASLLSHGSSSDYSLLLINGVVPNNIGLTWLGWNSGGVADGISVACVHHPGGTFKRISFGNKASNPTCGGANHIRVNWTSGPTEPGSSGAGVFLNNSNKQLVGQLHCGPSSCSSVSNDSFGAFVATYPNISSFMTGGGDDSSEANDTCPAARSVAVGTLTGRVVKIADEDWYRIVVPSGKTLKITLTFTHAFGDVDMRLFRNCSGTGGGTQVASSATTTNTEVISFKNTGAAASFFWRVYLFNDTRNFYDMKIQLL